LASHGSALEIGDNEVIVRWAGHHYDPLVTLRR